MELTSEQKAKFVWLLCIDMYNRPMLTALEITHGKEIVKLISNLEFKYQDDIDSGKFKNLTNFYKHFNEDLSDIDEELLS